MRYPTIILSVILALESFPVMAGPPFVTDDPEPVEYQHFEINTAFQGASHHDGFVGAFPTVDINYGLIPEVQLHLNVSAPLLIEHMEATQFGYGDTEIGVKYRFIQESESDWWPQVAIYPNFEVPTGNAEKSLGSGYERAYLPVWMQKSFGPWTSYGGIGYWINTHATNRDYWAGGWLLQRQITDKLILGGEFFEHTKSSVDDKITAGFNLGGSYDLDETHHLLFSIGTGVRNAAETDTVSFYLGYQLIY